MSHCWLWVHPSRNTPFQLQRTMSHYWIDINWTCSESLGVIESLAVAVFKSAITKSAPQSSPASEMITFKR